MSRCGCAGGTCACVLIALDTPCVNTTVTGVGSSENPYVISAVPTINPAAGNLLECGSSGLLADLSTLDSNCIDFSGLGTNASPLTANLIVSPATSGCIQCSSTGVRLTINPAAGNLLECGSSGLLADLSTLDSNCIDFSGLGTNASPLTASLVVSPPTSGCVSCTPQGLQLTFSPLGGITCGPSGITATFPESLILVASDETTAITTGVAKFTFRMPFAMTLTSVRASLTTASSGGTPTFDINESGATILSTTITIDVGEKTSTTAAIPPVISDSALADDAEITIDFDVAGTGATGVKIYFIGTRT